MTFSTYNSITNFSKFYIIAVLHIFMIFPTSYATWYFEKLYYDFLPHTINFHSSYFMHTMKSKYTISNYFIWYCIRDVFHFFLNTILSLFSWYLTQMLNNFFNLLNYHTIQCLIFIVFYLLCHDFFSLYFQHTIVNFFNIFIYTLWPLLWYL